jgi:hypothetical protein
LAGRSDGYSAFDAVLYKNASPSGNFAEEKAAFDALPMCADEAEAPEAADSSP